jgi:putative phosphoribosyl transferase
MSRVSDFVRGSGRAPYADRRAAGRVLAEALTAHAHSGAVVIGLARGGVPVAAEVAAALGAPLDVAVVRKLGVPGHEELAFGAISGTRMVRNDRLIRALGITESTVQEVIEREQRELRRREAVYRGGRPARPIAGREVILVDDGVATGASMQVAALDAHTGGAAGVIIAVPTAPHSAGAEFAYLTKEFVCPHTPGGFVAVGVAYADFSQVSDDEVCALLLPSG